MKALKTSKPFVFLGRTRLPRSFTVVALLLFGELASSLGFGMGGGGVSVRRAPVASPAPVSPPPYHWADDLSVACEQVSELSRGDQRILNAGGAGADSIRRTQAEMKARCVQQNVAEFKKGMLACVERGGAGSAWLTRTPSDGATCNVTGISMGKTFLIQVGQRRSAINRWTACVPDDGLGAYRANGAKVEACVNQMVRGMTNSLSKTVSMVSNVKRAAALPALSSARALAETSK